MKLGAENDEFTYLCRVRKVSRHRLSSAQGLCDPLAQVRHSPAGNRRENLMVRSLAERLRSHEQQKARLAEQEAKLKDAGRKARTRQLIEAGGLMEKAGLLGLEPNALYGALLSLRDGADDKDQVGKWAVLGGRTFAREAKLRDEGKEAIVLTFPVALDKEVTTTLRTAGFRFNKVLQHWEGMARFDEAKTLATTYGGSARQVAAGRQRDTAAE